MRYSTRNTKLYIGNYDPFPILYQRDFKNINLANKWLDRYVKFIKSRSNRLLSLNTPTNIHHIIPVSWGGSDDQCNLITLSIKEHIIAHHLLSRTGDYSAQCAFMITIANNQKQFNYNVTVNLITEAIENAIRAKQRPVVNLTTQQIYPSVKSACRAINRRDGSMHLAIKKKRKCGGYYWEFVDAFDCEVTPKSIADKLLQIEQQKQNNKRSWKEAHCSPIVNLTTKEIFWHVQDAARVYGGNGHNIKIAAKKYQQAGGCWWVTLDQLDDLSSKSIEKRIEFLQSQIPVKRKLRDQRCIKPIVNLTTGEKYSGGVYEVAQKYNLKCLGWISKCCRLGLKLRGCFWAYY